MLASVSSEAAPRSVVVLIWPSDPGVNGQCQQIVASNHFSAARKIAALQRRFLETTRRT